MDILVAYLAATVPTFLLVFARTAGFFLQAPVFSNRLMPPNVRVSLMVGLSIAALAAMPSYVSVPNMLWAFIMLIMQEILVGALFGFASSILFFAIQSAGELAGVQSGMSAASVLNPFTRSNVNAFGTLYFNLALLTFLVIGGHLWLLGAYMQTFALIPLGTFALTPAVMNHLVSMTGVFLVITLQLALPILTVVLLADLGVGYMSKVSPQASSLTQDLILIGKPVAGLSILTILMPNLVSVIHGHTEQMINNLNALMRAASTVSP
ncbi:MAG: flagellar biosynthetic protein FliR [Candidatus Sericytochromatia bacterium]|nr:flagellar biosynthetic protein FliR [Candidatus Sericytochromatia bacterium]